MPGRALGVAGGRACRDDRRGSSASEVGTDDETAPSPPLQKKRRLEVKKIALIMRLV